VNDISACDAQRMAGSIEPQFASVLGQRIECVRHAGRRDKPTLVFLHEGLGSVAMWRDFPQRVADATGHPALVYSRAGYGLSSPLAEARRPDYMHAEALTTLPALLDLLGIERPILLGHSDGASIALIHAGAGLRTVHAVAAISPHVFVESLSLSSIAKAKTSYETGDLRQRLARYHADVDSAFRGWNDIWLAPAFRDWNIESWLDTVTCPVLLVQGSNDEYGTLAQLDAIQRRVRGPVERLELEACGHSPQRDQPLATLAALRRFIASLA
jgi:pimeloyl-ACP methyl ester carboxylesterase